MHIQQCLTLSADAAAIRHVVGYTLSFYKTVSYRARDTNKLLQEQKTYFIGLNL